MQLTTEEILIKALRLSGLSPNAALLGTVNNFHKHNKDGMYDNLINILDTFIEASMDLDEQQGGEA